MEREREEVKQTDSRTATEENEWKLVIRWALNGYVLEGRFGDRNFTENLVIEENEKDDLEHHQKLLWEVMEYFGFQGSKHDPERLRVTREKKDEDDD